MKYCFWKVLLAMLLALTIAVPCVAEGLDIEEEEAAWTADVPFGDYDNTELPVPEEEQAILAKPLEEIAPEEIEFPLDEIVLEKDESPLGEIEQGLEASIYSDDSAAAAKQAVMSSADDYRIIDGVLVEYTGLDEDVMIPYGVTEIGEEAFAWCEDITSVTIPDSVTAIGQDAFIGCTGLARISIPGSVTSIGENAFCECAGLSNVVISEGVASIGDGAFQNCTNLTEICIPNSVKHVGRSAFCCCEKLTTAILPEGMTSIPDRIFENCNGLKTVNIPNSITSIGECSFFSCYNLKEIVIPPDVTFIDEGAFCYCKKLKSVSIPDGLSFIMSKAFAYCKSLTDIVIPDSVTSIGYSAFEGCSRLTSITVPDSVTYIGSDMFDHCSHLAAIFIMNANTEINDTAFNRCPKTLVFFLSGNGKASKWAEDAGYAVIKSDPTPVILQKKALVAQVSAGDRLQVSVKGNIKSYKSSNTKVASISSNGLITAKAGGTAKITVTLKNNKKALSMTLKVKPAKAPKKVTINNGKTATLMVGNTLNLKTSLTPENARTTLTWTSSNKKVATVSSKGVVKALKPGVATITVKTANNKKARCKITTVKAPKKRIDLALYIGTDCWDYFENSLNLTYRSSGYFDADISQAGEYSDPNCSDQYLDYLWLEADTMKKYSIGGCYVGMKTSKAVKTLQNNGWISDGQAEFKKKMTDHRWYNSREEKWQSTVHMAFYEKEGVITSITCFR